MHRESRNLLLGLLLVVLPAGCGIIEIERTLFPTQPTDSQGQPLFVEDLEDITGDTSLLPQGIADGLRGLGIQSESFINAVVDDGLGAITTPPAVDTGGGAAAGDTTTPSGG